MAIFDRARRGLLLGAAALAGTGFCAAESLFAPESALIKRWAAHDPKADGAVDHGIWAELLARRHMVDAKGVARFRYADFDAADSRALAAYLDGLAAVPIDRLARPEQLAFWINLYNATVVRTVLEHYPVRSIQDIDTSPGLFTNGPWKARAAKVQDAVLSLDDIEHGVLRPVWRDPRIHYAVNCAAVGCPNLSGEPYAPARIEAQLDAQARGYVNDPRGVAFDRDGGLIVSKIYAWFCDDFGGDDRSVIAHLRRYADPALAKRLQGVRSIADARYDWALNDAAAAG